MNKFSAFLWVACLTMTHGAFSQAKLVEKVTKKGNEIVIPYEKYVLPNGLTLVIHEDHSDPIVHVDVTYHVGSAREEINKSGFAHFFEHMMFQGSDNVADEEHFKIVNEAGGTLNGTTNYDRTNYFETLPANQLEIALWLEADRMGFLLDAVTQKKFEIQRATVKNERGENYDNRPYGLVSEALFKNMFPYGHPYSWLTIGYVEDLDRVDVNDLKNFFLRWYGPNNAVVTVGGDVKPKEVVKLVEKYFGSIPRGPEVKDMPAMPAKLDKDRYVSFEDNYIQFPLLYMVFPSVPARHPDEIPLKALAEILGQGNNSIIYQNLVKTQNAIQANANNGGLELAGFFGISVLPLPGKTLADMEKMLRASIAEFEKRGVTDEDVQKFIAQQESKIINSLASVSGKVSQLAAYQTFEGNPNYIKTELARLQSLKKEDIARVYNQYIKNKNAVILSYYPKGKKDLAAEDNHTIDQSGYKAPDYGYEGLVYNKAKDNFDRSKKPSSGPNPVVKVPPFWKNTFTNGMQLIGTQNDEIPTVSLIISIPYGHWDTDVQKAGLANITTEMMGEGTEKYTTEQIAKELEKLGSTITFSTGQEETTVQVQCLKKNLDKTLTLLEEKLFRPRFDVQDFERNKKQILQAIKHQSTQPNVVADEVFNKTLYGQNSLRAISQLGTIPTLEAITLEDVKAFYNKWGVQSENKAGYRLVVVGDITEKEILPKLGFLGKPGTPTVPTELVKKYDSPKPLSSSKIYLVDKPKSAQSEIRIGYVNPKLTYDATGEYYKSRLSNFVLGGAPMNSRINLNLREDKGWTYGAFSYFSANKHDTRFTAQASVKATATDSSIVEFTKEIKSYAEKGITDEELAFTKSSIGQQDALKYESPFQKAAFLSRILEYNLPNDFADQQNKILQNLSKEEVNSLAKKHLPYSQMAIITVGDKETIFEGLKKLGYPITELDVNGNVVAEDAIKVAEDIQKKKAEEAKAGQDPSETSTEPVAPQEDDSKKKKSKKKKK